MVAALPAVRVREDPAIETSLPFSAALLPSDVSPGDTLYVADRELNVVYGNDEWTGFASLNAGDGILEQDWNANLLENFIGAARERWQRIYGLLLDGSLPDHREEMICSSPVEKRVYQLRITPTRDPASELTWLVHHAVRVDAGASREHAGAGSETTLETKPDAGREFQERMTNRLVRLSGLHVATHFEPLEQVGGDLVWHREYPGGTSDLVHADVMGHGEDAARIAAQLIDLLEEHGQLDRGPAALIARLNRAMLEVVEDVVFATGLVFRFEPDRSRVICCGFGHTDPIFSRTGPVTLEAGLPIGLFEDQQPWVEKDLGFDEHGARFLVFSDGVTEQFNRQGEMFGMEGLTRTFQKNLSLPLDQMLTRILECLDEFRGDALIKDDRTLLAVEAGT